MLCVVEASLFIHAYGDKNGIMVKHIILYGCYLQYYYENDVTQHLPVSHRHK